MYTSGGSAKRRRRMPLSLTLTESIDKFPMETRSFHDWNISTSP